MAFRQIPTETAERALNPGAAMIPVGGIIGASLVALTLFSWAPPLPAENPQETGP